MRGARSRGFTLLEIVTTLAMASAIASSIFGIVYIQTRTFLERVEDNDAHQNGRAAISVLRQALQNARFGMGTDPEAAGVVGVGACYMTGNHWQFSGACNNLTSDFGADRLRIVSAVPNDQFVNDNVYDSGSNCADGEDDTPSLLHVGSTRPGFASGDWVILGGGCAGSSDPTTANDLLRITGDSPGANCPHRYGYIHPLTGVTSLSCGLGYTAPFALGRAQIHDFFLARLADGTPCLMFRQSTIPTQAPQVVAFNVEDLQVRYGIDLTDPVDGRADVWCSDPRSNNEVSGGCPSGRLPSGGAPYTSTQMYNRIVAVQVAVRVRSDVARPERAPAKLDPTWLVDNPIADPSDGYQRSLYVTTVALRNSSLP